MEFTRAARRELAGWTVAQGLGARPLASGMARIASEYESYAISSRRSKQEIVYKITAGKVRKALSIEAEMKNT
jgi:hypothetical protein